MFYNWIISPMCGVTLLIILIGDGSIFLKFVKIITGALSSTDPSVFDQGALPTAQEALSTVSTSGK